MYKRQEHRFEKENLFFFVYQPVAYSLTQKYLFQILKAYRCLLYTSDAADERSSVDLGGRRIIKKKKELLLLRTSHV